MILYKYTKIKLETLARLGQIFLTDPKDFNDPYDCFYHTVINSGEELGGGRLEEFKENLRKLEPFGCYCLTKNPKNLLMWSHYANGHKGICIGYNVEKICDIQQDLFQVDYNFQCEYENFGNMFGDLCGLMNTSIMLRQQSIDESKKKENDKKIVKILFAKKASNWKYEKEWRILRYLDDPKTNKITANVDITNSKREKTINPNEAINSIILGARMDDQVREIISKYIKEKYPKINLKQAKLSNECYKIKIMPYNLF